VISTKVSTLLLMFIADCHSANLKFLKMVRLLAAKVWVGVNILVWHEICNLHKMGRCMFHLMKTFDFNGPLYSLSKICRLGKHKRDAQV
jgi:hypothetical protein